MGRYRLLRTLHEAGINDFNAYLVAEGAIPAAYPVFIRRNSSSTVPLTDLIHDKVELGRKIDHLIAQGEVPEDLVIIEFCGEEVRPGIYRKQSEYRIADRYIQTPTIYGGTWLVKFSNTIAVPEDLTAFDIDVLDRNPLVEVARQAFEMAGIEYGRADIGIVGGRPQVYEINFNPDMRTQCELPNTNIVLGALWDRSDTMFFDALRRVSEEGSGTKPSLSTGELTAFRLRFWRNYAPQRY